MSDKNITDYIAPYCEFQELSIDEISGKAKIKMSALQIHMNDFDYQSNGLNWVKQYVLNNIESAKHMHYVVSWLNEEEQIPRHHGMQETNEYGEVIFTDSVVVGDVRDVYFETIDVNGVSTEVLMTEGFINTQRYNKFYHWLKGEIDKGTIYGSVELRGKKNGKIVYYGNRYQNTDGTPFKGRKPEIFDFSDLAILYVTAPADNASQVIEINNEHNLTINKEEKTVDKNDGNVNEVVVELNAKLIESNTKINDITNELNAAKIELNNYKSDITAKESEINTLKEEKNELSETVVGLNKKVTELEAEAEENKTKIEELDAYKKDKEENESKVEVNSYFDTEISKNGFTEAETNELKSFVEKNDLDGLKNAEKDLVLKKYKESLFNNVEVNNFVNKASGKKKETLTKDDFWN